MKVCEEGILVAGTNFRAWDFCMPGEPEGLAQPLVGRFIMMDRKDGNLVRGSVW